MKIMIKKLLLMLALLLTFTLNVQGNPNTITNTITVNNSPVYEHIIYKETNVEITQISVNLPAQLFFYEVDSLEQSRIVVRFRGEAKERNIIKWIDYEFKNGVLSIKLKNYLIEEMTQLDPKNVRIYIPSEYYGKIKTQTGLSITTSVNKNDSGKSTK